MNERKITNQEQRCISQCINKYWGHPHVNIETDQPITGRTVGRHPYLSLQCCSITLVTDVSPLFISFREFD